MKTAIDGACVLGLDVGPNSVGWALVRCEGDRPTGIAAAGVRVFDAGLEDLEIDGKGKSRNVARRDARTHRRLLDRRARRLGHLFRLLQGAGLLPAGGCDTPQQRHEILKTLDTDLFARQGSTAPPTVPASDQVLPYLLRAKALDERLEPFALGRALYHLAQRRGFLSNRKAPPKDAKKKEEEGMKKEISDLSRDIAASARTLGEFFSRLNPHERRIRTRHTSRQMYEEEFERVWTAQAPHHPAILTADLKKKVRKAIFFQRPLKSVARFIGQCELEPDRRRAPWALLAAQRFRLLQRVNDLEVLDKVTGEVWKMTDASHREDRGRLVHALETEGDLTFTKVRKLLHLPRAEFNLERGGEEKLPGNRTVAKLRPLLGERWDLLSPQERDHIVHDLRSIRNDEVLARRGRTKWGLDDESARKFSQVSLEDGHCSLSRQALARLLPLMEQGISYATARKEVYGERPTVAVDQLPRLSEALPALRNPIVARALTEVRKVVNAIVRTYGKPATIRVELARVLKRNPKQREQTWKKNRENQRGRDAARERAVREAGIPDPRPGDIEKVVLAEECDWTCPYTGRHFGMTELFGSPPHVDIEHIIPFDRCLDDSFINKTLCFADENRNVKKGRTPFEAYGADKERWDAILQRVKRFRNQAKLERFELAGVELQRFLENYSARQLTDTAYAAREAARLLGRFYGCREDQPGVDADGTRRIQVGSGQVTAYLRSEWGLNSILGDGGLKTREDHRHHAVDAVAIALTDAKTVKMLSDAAARAPSERRRRFGAIPEPWPNFLDEVRTRILSLVVSHRTARKITGPLHKETFYSPPQQGVDDKGRRYTFHLVRKPLAALSTGDLDDIADPVVRKTVREKREALGGGDPKKVFALPQNHPALMTRDARAIPIHKVRLRQKVSPVPFGVGYRERWALTGSNHHVEILEVKDAKDRVKWEGEIVTTYEAMRRLQRREPVVKRDHGEGKRFVFSLCGGDAIQIEDKDGNQVLCQVRSIGRVTQGKREYVEVDFVDATDARKKKDMIATGAWKRFLIDPLRKANCRKVLIDPLGTARWAND
jgi:CRISPR-associated endonuclease Csn1